MAAYDEDSVLRRGRGRPRKENVFDYVIKVRLNDEQVFMLRECMAELHMTQSDVIREAIELLYNIGPQ